MAAASRPRLRPNELNEAGESAEPVFGQSRCAVGRYRAASGLEEGNLSFFVLFFLFVFLFLHKTPNNGSSSSNGVDFTDFKELTALFVGHVGGQREEVWMTEDVASARF